MTLGIRTHLIITLTSILGILYFAYIIIYYIVPHKQYISILVRRT